MARKSRRNTAADNTAAEPVTVFNTAIYARLSLEDGGKKGADTLDAQIELVRHFITQRPYLRLRAVFTDNGETGMNFDRPGFAAMMEEVKQGRINCIVVKDLSRLGRNYIDTGNYLETIFPLLKTRFIAVNDNYDNADFISRDNLVVSLKNLINDVYSKDISRKVKAAMAVKQRRGDFLGSNAAYGYLRRADDNRKLVVNPETAPTVRDIFAKRLAGESYAGIARDLNNAGTPSPARYLYLNGLVRHNKFANCLWDPTTVKGILKNPVYIGCMALGKKQSRTALGLPQLYVSPDKWLITPDAHEAIIDKKTFDAVVLL